MTPRSKSIALAEALLIEMFAPLWNRVLDGFGNHDPGKGRYNQQRSLWDTLHPGREWPQQLQPQSKTEADIHRLVKAHLDGRR